MINSNQINALMLQQQQQQAMLGMGAPGVALGASQFPPQYSHSINPFFTSQSLSGAGGIGGMMAGGVSGLGAGLSTLGTAASIGSMFGIGGGTIGGLAGSFLGLTPLSLPLMAGGAAIGAVGNTLMQANRANTQVGQFLSAANFANPMSPSGFGFGFNDQTRLTNQIIGMGAANPFVNQQEQSQLLNQFQQMGLDKGITSMGKMIEKFKEFSKSSEDLAMQLGKTVSEVTGLVGQLRGQGFYSAAEVSGQMSRITAGSRYGLTIDQQMQMSQNMASMTRGMGMSSQAGALMGVNLAQTLGAANEAGFISGNRLMDLTGATNTADAITALSQGLGGRLGGAMTGGGPLENLLSAFMRVDEGGNMTIDEGIMQGVATGRVGINDLTGLSRRNMTQPGFRGAFMANRRELASEFLSSEQGLGATLGMFRNLAADTARRDGTSEEDAFKILMDQYGIAGEREADMLFELSQNLEETQRSSMNNRARQMAAERRRAYLARERSFEGLKRKISHEASITFAPPEVQQAFVSGTNTFNANLARLEREIFGAEYSKTAMFTEQNVNEVMNRFLSGDLNASIAAQGNLTGRERTLRNLTGDLSEEGRAAFTDFITGGRQSDVSLDTSAFENYGGGTDRFVGRFNLFQGARGGMKAHGAETLFMGTMAGQIRRLLSTGSKFEYDNLVAEAMRKGASSEEEAQAMIASSSPEAAAALQRHLANTMGEGGSLLNRSKESFLNQAAGGVSATQFSGGMLGANLGSFVNPLVGSAIGGALGSYLGDTQGELKQMLESGVGTTLLSKLSSKKDLKSFDQMMRSEMLTTGNREEAMQNVADKMSTKLGQPVTAEDVSAALRALHNSSGLTFRERIESDDYGKALELTKGAKGYLDQEILTNHLDELKSAVAGEDVAGLEDLQKALSADNMNVGEVQRAMADVAERAASGGFEYTGDNEVIRALAGAGSLSKDLMGFVGKDVSSLDEVFGAGSGAQLRKRAGVRATGGLSRAELQKMASVAAQADAFNLVTADAANEAASLGTGSGTDAHVKATTSLLTSAEQLAVYVDNIGTALTGQPSVGKSIPGMRNAIDRNIRPAAGGSAQ